MALPDRFKQLKPANPGQGITPAPKLRAMEALRKPSGFTRPTTPPSKSVNRNPINRPNPNPGVGDNTFPGNLSPIQPKPGGGYTFPGKLSPQQPNPGAGNTFPGTLTPAPNLPDKPTTPGGMIGLDPREWDGTFNKGNGNYFPGFPSQPSDPQPGLEIPPGHIGGGDYYYPGVPSNPQPSEPMQPPTKAPGLPTKPGTPGISPDPVKKNGRSMQGDDTTRKFVMDAFDKGFDAKTILNFLASRFKR